MENKKTVVKDKDLEKVSGGTLLQNEGTILNGGANTQYIPTITVTEGNYSGFFDSNCTYADNIDKDIKDDKKKMI